MPNDVHPPSVFLPPVRSIKNCSDKEISNVISSLRRIYLPEVRGSTRRRHGPQCSTAPSAYPIPSQEAQYCGHDPKSETKNLEIIRADNFERSFAIQWLTRFVSLFSDISGEPQGTARAGSQGLEEAASLLAICAGAAASGAVTRTFTFSLSRHLFQSTVGHAVDIDYGSSLDTTSANSRNFSNESGRPASITTGDEGRGEISIILRDAPLESADFSGVGVQTWGGSCILAEMIADSPQTFGISPRTQDSGSNPAFRAMELGAGTGLASLVLGKTLERIRGAPCQPKHLYSSTDFERVIDTLVATDFHPSVLTNLRMNFAANFPSQIIDTQSSLGNYSTPKSHASAPAFRVAVLPLDWSKIHELSDGPPPSESLENLCMYEVGPLSDADNNRPFHSDSDSRDGNACMDRLHDADANTKSPKDTQAQGPRIHQQQNSEPSQLSSIEPLLDTPFDLIIGTDIIYERMHARWVRSCVERFLKKPLRRGAHADTLHYKPAATTYPMHSADSDIRPFVTDQRPPFALFHLIIPLRRTHAVESRSIKEVFSSAADVLSFRQNQPTGTLARTLNASGIGSDPGIPPGSDRTTISQTGTISDSSTFELAIISQEDISCDAYSDRKDSEDVVYRYYKIGWV